MSVADSEAYVANHARTPRNYNSGVVFFFNQKQRRGHPGDLLSGHPSGL
jgi:hypothetical protein